MKVLFVVKPCSGCGFGGIKPSLIGFVICRPSSPFRGLDRTFLSEWFRRTILRQGLHIFWGARHPSWEYNFRTITPKNKKKRILRSEHTNWADTGPLNFKPRDRNDFADAYAFM